MSNIFRFLTDDGLVTDGTNEVMIVDGSSTAVPFYVGPAAGKVWDLHRMIVHIEDGSATSSLFGGLSALTNGLLVQHMRSGITGTEVLSPICQHPVKKNGDWASYCHDLTMDAFGAGNAVVSVRWTFTKGGAPITLVGHTEDKFMVTVRDALAGLVEFHIMVQGVEYER